RHSHIVLRSKPRANAIFSMVGYSPPLMHAAKNFSSRSLHSSSVCTLGILLHLVMLFRILAMSTPLALVYFSTSAVCPRLFFVTSPAIISHPYNKVKHMFGLD